MPVKKLITSGLHSYWRVSRGLTMGAQGCVIDSAERILLIRHAYRSGWHFPGGGVETNETLETALARELREETGIILNDRPVLFGVYAHHRIFRGDHIALYVVRAWNQPAVPLPNREVAEQGFFAANELPRDINPPTALRIAEVLQGRAPAEMW